MKTYKKAKIEYKNKQNAKKRKKINIFNG